MCDNRTSSTTDVATIESVVSEGECVGLTVSKRIEIGMKVGRLTKQDKEDNREDDVMRKDKINDKKS